MKRRTFIFGASAASLGLASVGGVFWRRNYLARKGVELLRKRITLGELTQQIGEAYLEANPKSSEWSLFAEIVGPRKLEEGWREDGGEKLAGHVQWQIRTEAGQGLFIEEAGWILSPCEVKLYALLVLTKDVNG